MEQVGASHASQATTAAPDPLCVATSTAEVDEVDVNASCISNNFPVCRCCGQASHFLAFNLE